MGLREVGLDRDGSAQGVGRLVKTALLLQDDAEIGKQARICTVSRDSPMQQFRCHVLPPRLMAKQTEQMQGRAGDWVRPPAPGDSMFRLRRGAQPDDGQDPDQRPALNPRRLRRGSSQHRPDAQHFSCRPPRARPGKLRRSLEKAIKVRCSLSALAIILTIPRPPVYRYKDMRAPPAFEDGESRSELFRPKVRSSGWPLRDHSGPPVGVRMAIARQRSRQSRAGRSERRLRAAGPVPAIPCGLRGAMPCRFVTDGHQRTGL
jgi:hypothetical protein